jgi:hypothetical protein
MSEQTKRLTSILSKCHAYLPDNDMGRAVTELAEESLNIGIRLDALEQSSPQSEAVTGGEAEEIIKPFIVRSDSDYDPGYLEEIIDIKGLTAAIQSLIERKDEQIANQSLRISSQDVAIMNLAHQVESLKSQLSAPGDLLTEEEIDLMAKQAVTAWQRDCAPSIVQSRPLTDCEEHLLFHKIKSVAMRVRAKHRIAPRPSSGGEKPAPNCLRCGFPVDENSERTAKCINARHTMPGRTFVSDGTFPRPSSVKVEIPDANVESVKRLLDERAARGLQKYGVTTERDDLSELEWLRHLQDELLDGAIYCQRNIKRLTKEPHAQ